jgi:tetratricopeptide (TPR) repeat protein
MSGAAGFQPAGEHNQSPDTEESAVPDQARQALRAALALHERGDIDRALAEARRALELAPGFADARSYLGATLVMRKGDYGRGLAEIERAAELAPDDPAVQYTLGWCCEFVAYRLSKRPAGGDLEPQTLYRRAEQALRRCIELDPPGKLKDDARDLLSSIIREDVE